MRNDISTRLFFLLPALLLVCAAPLCAQRFARETTESELFDYIHSEKADAACGICLNSAQKHFNGLRQKELLKKTTGMVLVPAGKHHIGSPGGIGDPDERPPKEIYLDAFFIDKTEVTLRDYLQFARGTNANYPEWLAPGGRFNMNTGADDYYKRLTALIASCDNCPVFGVTWENANAYCLWKKKRLPTDAEWEAAARAGSKARYSFGDAPDRADEYSWNETNSREIPHPVALKKPNKYGLYDMHGNVWEWVSDFYDKDYYNVRPDRNPPGPATGREHIIRGGSWFCDADSTRSGNRASYKKANDDIGFRCVVPESELYPTPTK